jgi:uroporphyrin-III C-methyltransferase/precorrin-2 dehydrogenase/sirohydrochlorin ferrochelatase
VTSAIAVPAAAGIPVTHRGVAQEFVVVSGHLPPDHPDSRVNWPALAALRGTVCVLMGLKNLPAIVEVLLAAGRPGSTPVAVIQEGTTNQQHVVRAPLAEVAQAVAGIRSPAVVVIGPVVEALSS